MTDVDRSSLDRILPATPGSPDWDDVLRRSGARHVGRRRRIVVFAAAILGGLLVRRFGSAVASAFGPWRTRVPPQWRVLLPRRPTGG